MNAENGSRMTPGVPDNEYERTQHEELQADDTKFDDTPPEKRTYTSIPLSLLSIIGGSLACYIIVGWLAYATGTDGEFAMLIATVFAVVAIGVPALLVAVGVGRTHARPTRARVWLRGLFDTWTGTIRAREALVQVLLPITATVVGFTLIAIVLASVHAGVVSPG